MEQRNSLAAVLSSPLPMNHRSEGPERCPQRTSGVTRLPPCSVSSGCFSQAEPELCGGESAPAAPPTSAQHLHLFGICTHYRLSPHPTTRHLPPRHLLPRLRRSSTRIVWGIVRKFSLTRRCIHFHVNDGSSSRLEFCHRWAPMQKKTRVFGGKNLQTCAGCATPWAPFSGRVGSNRGPELVQPGWSSFPSRSLSGLLSFP